MQQVIVGLVAEQQAVDGAGRLVLVVAGKNGVHRVPDLELAHDAFADPVRLIKRLRDDPVESSALGQPAPCGEGLDSAKSDLSG